MFVCDFITYNGLYRKINTEKLNIPTKEGRRTILSNHMETMFPVSVGVIETKEDNDLRHYAITEGILYFKDNKATLICDQILRVDDINVDMAMINLKKAEEQLKMSIKDSDVIRAKVQIARAANLINAHENYTNNEK